MKRKLMGLLAAVAMVTGLAPVAATSAVSARPASQYASYTDCSQSSSLGARVCYDQSTGYGPLIYVYNGATTLQGVYFPIGGVLSPSAIFWQWESNWNGTQVVLSGAPVPTMTIGTPTTGAASLQVAPNVLDVLHLAAVDPNYEFVIAS